MVGGDGDRDRGIDPRQLLDGDRVGEGVGARAPVLLRNGHPHQPELGELGDEVIRKTVLAIELRGDWGNSRLGEVADRVADELLLLGQVEVQAASLSASSQIRRTP